MTETDEANWHSERGDHERASDVAYAPHGDQIVSSEPQLVAGFVPSGEATGPMTQGVVDMSAFVSAERMPDKIDQLRRLMVLDPHLQEASQSRDFSIAIGCLSAGDLIGLAESIPRPVGSLAIIQVYKIWLTFSDQKLEKKSYNATIMSAIWFNLGTEYGMFGDVQNKVTCYKNAMELKADFHPAAVNLGLTYEAENQTDLALTILQNALQSDDARTMILNNLGRIHENGNKFAQAKKEYTISLFTNPDQNPVLHHLIGLRAKTCDWPTHALTIPGVSREDMVNATRALTLLAMFDDLTMQRQGNASWIEEKMPPVAVPFPARGRPSTGKIRLGYLSSDFCMHPIAFLVAELIETHDRDRFEVHGFCSTKEDNSPVRKRIVGAFDVFHDIRNVSDEQAAGLIYDQKIDILIDLNGLTLGTRLQVLRSRPAPIQMTYLGYNGPIPLPELDFIIADEYVIPPDMADEYGPKPLYMSKCFQVNDSSLVIRAAQARKEAALPDDKFVFCCFSNTYKVTEDIFAAWMTILTRVPDAVLWIYVDNEDAKQNMSRVAAERGIAPERLLYASRVEPSLYRGRLSLADLFLDTFPYNAGTTASDALRVGLPILTISGESFISRMAGSLMQAMGLKDGIVSSVGEYIEAAVALASDRTRYQALRASVTPEKWREALGDTPGFCRELERTFETLVADLS